MARTARTPAVKSVKSRIAGALGITSPPTGRTIPMVKSERSGDARKADFSASAFSIFGDKEQLIHFEE